MSEDTEETLFMRIKHLISDILLLSALLLIVIVAIAYFEVNP